MGIFFACSSCMTSSRGCKMWSWSSWSSPFFFRKHSKNRPADFPIFLCFRQFLRSKYDVDLVINHPYWTCSSFKVSYNRMNAVKKPYHQQKNTQDQRKNTSPPPPPTKNTSKKIRVVFLLFSGIAILTDPFLGFNLSGSPEKSNSSRHLHIGWKSENSGTPK